MTTIGGRVAAGYEHVRDVFAENFDDDLLGDVGAACCAFVDGACVVDLYGGVADRGSERPWTAQTMVGTFSMTKGLSALLVNRWIEAGRLEPEAPVARYWPEFAANGKQAITVAQLLSHQAGLAVIDGEFDLASALAWDPVVAQLASQAPAWEPGSAHGYHLRSFGWLVGELLRRADPQHRTMGRQLHDDIVVPLGLDGSLYVGLPAEASPRVATLVTPPPALFERIPRDWPLWRAMTGPSELFRYDDMWNRADVRAAELPSSNGIGTARAFATVYASLVGAGVDGQRMLGAEATARAATPLATGPDRVTLVETGYGLGFMVGPSVPPALGAGAFGHGGAGGSGGYADPQRRLAVAFVMNRLRFDPDDQRCNRLVHAVVAACDDRAASR